MLTKLSVPANGDSSRAKQRPRTRIFADDSENGDAIRYYVPFNGDPEWILDTTFAPISSLSHSMEDVVTPDFKKRSAMGELINSPMTHIKTEYTTNFGGYLSTHDSSGDQIYAGGDGSVIHRIRTLHGPALPMQVGDLDTIISDLVATTRAEALARIDQTPFSFMEDIAEIKKTFRFLESSFRAIIKIIAKARRRLLAKQLGKGVRFSKTLQYETIRFSDLPALWLQVRFAVRPLLISISKSIQVLEEGLKKNIQPVRRTSRYTQTAHGSDSIPERVGTATQYWDWILTHHYDVEVSSGVVYEVSNPIDTYQEILGLRFDDIVPTLWEIMPFSWAIDYFIDVGGMIRAFNTLSTPGVEVLTAWTTIKINFQNQTILVDEVLDGQWTTSYANGSDGYSQVSTTRVPWSGSAVQAIPSFGTSLSLPQLTDLAAIVLNGLKTGRSNLRI